MTSSDCTQMPVQQATAGSSALLQVTVYPPARDGFGALKDEWNGLLRKSRFNSLFLTWEWQTTWRNLGRGKRGFWHFVSQRRMTGWNCSTLIT